MSLILNIDTALETAYISLARDSEIVAFKENQQQHDHASWLHPAIEELCSESDKDLKQLNAVAVSIGPGSFTGLRVGLSAAKGFCYALSIPLITVSSLEILAHSVDPAETDLICSMIDARRMEVYAAVYDKYFVEKIPPFAAVLEESSFNDILPLNRILFCGNGSKKLQSILTHPNARFQETGDLIHSMSRLSNDQYTGNKFAVLAYTEPLYVKEFYSPSRDEVRKA